MKDVLTFKDLTGFIKWDFERINGKITFRKLMMSLLFEPGFKYIFWMRITRYFWLKRGLARIPFVLCRFILKHFAYKYTFDVSYRAKIGPGLSIAHHGYIVVRAAALIGENCSLRPGVVIGKKLTDDVNAAVLENNVDIGVGAKILGDVHIGNNVTIGANAVVTNDVPDNAIVAGIPARVLGYRNEDTTNEPDTISDT